MSETIEDLIAQGDKVVGRFVLTGTHQGPFLGIAPTGKRIRVTGIDIVRFQNGRITDLWYNEDTFGLYEQLGVSPDSGESG